jgi:hypothetical protein
LAQPGPSVVSGYSGYSSGQTKAFFFKILAAEEKPLIIINSKVEN